MFGMTGTMKVIFSTKASCGVPSLNKDIVRLVL